MRGFLATLAICMCACGTVGVGAGTDAGANDVTGGNLADAVADATDAAEVTDASDVTDAGPAPVDSQIKDVPADAAPVDDAVAPVDAADCGSAVPAHATCSGTGWTCDSGWFQPYESSECAEATCPVMGQAVSSAIQKAIAKSTACTADADCAVAQTSTTCQGTCGAAVNKAQMGALAGVVAWVDDHICKPQKYGAKCGYATPSCLAPNPGCVNGQCVYAKPAAGPCGAQQPPNTVCQGSTWVCKPGYFRPYGGGECTEATCANLTAAKNEALATVLVTAKACTGAEAGECIVVPTSTDCGGTCGVAVNGGMANDVAKIVGWVDDNLCKAFEFKAKCGYSSPKCMQPKPGCVQGMCSYDAGNQP